MHPQIAAKLLELNRKFYHDFGKAFALTRQRIQPGVRHVLSLLSNRGKWLDLGCGSGTLAAEWVHSGKCGLYVGIDFSDTLLDEAKITTENFHNADVTLRFYALELNGTNWPKELITTLVGERLLSPDGNFDGILAFAMLHHIPSAEMRLTLMRQVRNLLSAGGMFVHSEWQFQHSRRLMARRIPWDTIGLRADDVEEKDTLIDWRYALPGQVEQTGMRYVHLFDNAELADLAYLSGFEICETFESDGEGGKLGLYQIWKAILPYNKNK